MSLMNTYFVHLSIMSRKFSSSNWMAIKFCENLNIATIPARTIGGARRPFLGITTVLVPVKMFCLKRSTAGALGALSVHSRCTLGRSRCIEPNKI